MRNGNPLAVIGAKGYAIIETMIALAIFIVCVVPLTTGIMRAGKVRQSADVVTASCLLEQHSALIQTSPSQILPKKKKRIGKREWLVETSYEGGELRKYTVTVTQANKLVTSGQFYVYEGNRP